MIDGPICEGAGSHDERPIWAGDDSGDEGEDIFIEEDGHVIEGATMSDGRIGGGGGCVDSHDEGEDMLAEEDGHVIEGVMSVGRTVGVGRYVAVRE